MTEKNIIKKKPTISKSSSWRLLAQQTELPGFLPMGDEANQNHKLLANQQQVVQQPVVQPEEAVVGDDELREWAKEFTQNDNHDKQNKTSYKNSYDTNSLSKKILGTPVDQRRWTAPDINISLYQKENQQFRDQLFGTTSTNQVPSYTAKRYADQKAAEMKRKEGKERNGEGKEENKVPIILNPNPDHNTTLIGQYPSTLVDEQHDDVIDDTSWIDEFFDDKKTGGSKRRRFRKSKKSKRKKHRITRRRRR